MAGGFLRLLQKGPCMKALLQSLKDLGPAKLGAMGGVALLLLGFFTFLAMRSSQPMGLLYNELPMEESGRIVQYLDQNAIPYEVRGGGTQLYVPGDSVGKIRLQLAGQGLPSAKAGVGYEIFDKSDALGTSNFVHNVNMLRALEGELARTIGSIQNIDSARVHLVMPKRELFTREQKPPTASVALKLRGGNELGKMEVQAIRHLVSTSVPGLEVNRITITDDKGRLLARGAGEDDVEGAASEAEDYRVKFEQRMQARLVELLEKTLGEGNAQVSVSADIDFDRIVRKLETYDPQSQVARSVQNSSENENSVERSSDSNVSVQNNLPDPNASNAGLTSQTKKEKTDETINYEISKEIVNHVQEIGNIRRLSVAVLVNGTYVTAEDGTSTYNERQQADLDRIGKLVKSAIGFSEKRGDSVEVINLQFSDSLSKAGANSPLEWLKDDFHNILQTAILGVVAILAILLVIRPLVTRAIETSAFSTEEDEMDALEGPDVAGALTDQRGMGGAGGGQSGIAGLLEETDSMVDIANIEGGIKSSSLKRITGLIDNHPEETLTVLRGWMMSSH